MDARDALANGVNGSRHVEPYPARRERGEEAFAYGPIRRIERARVHSHADAVHPWAGNGDFFQMQLVCWLANRQAGGAV
jgi:hypothetical protein